DWILSQYSSVLSESLAETKLVDCRVEWSIQGAKPTIDRTHLSHERPTISNFPSEATVEAEAARFAEMPSALNQKYTFSTFVVASCNRFAHAAAQAVAESPGKTYNPLYLYGGVGLGKTHLIQATGHAIKNANPHLNVAYLSLERFMNELINAIRYGYDKTRVFRERYRSIDVLLIDDVQFI